MNSRVGQTVGRPWRVASATSCRRWPMNKGPLSSSSAPALCSTKVSKAVSNSLSLLASMTTISRPRARPAAFTSRNRSVQAVWRADRRWRAHAREIAAGPVETLDQPKLYRITAGDEHDRRRCGDRFGDLRRDHVGDDHGDVAADEIGSKRRHPIMMILGETILNRNVLAFHKSGLRQSAPERRHQMREAGSSRAS